jgi:hypothetical protein
MMDALEDPLQRFEDDANDHDLYAPGQTLVSGDNATTNKILQKLTDQMAAYARDSRLNQKFMRHVHASLGKLIDKIADFELQLADQRKEKEEMLANMERLIML